jgi:ubiquinone/menaquinone biosynthesis C-methylase UbiE
VNSSEKVIEQYKTSANLGARIQLHERFSVEPYPWMRWVFDQWALPPDAHILEVGCGTGKLWQENLDRLPPRWSVVLSDQSAGMLQQVRENLGDQAQRFRFEQFDMQAMPFADAQFDAVVANHMLYHVPDLHKGLSEIRRVLRPDDKFFAATNGSRHMGELGELVHDFDPNYSDKPWQLGFTLENGAELLAPYFHQIELRRFESALRVTEVAPLVAYVMSMSSIKLSPEQEPAFTAYVAAQLQRRGGALWIQKDTGLFCAVKGT